MSKKRQSAPVVDRRRPTGPEDVPEAAEHTVTPPAWRPRVDPGPLLPDESPFRLLGTEAAQEADPALLKRLHRELVLGDRKSVV